MAAIIEKLSLSLMAVKLVFLIVVAIVQIRR